VGRDSRIVPTLEHLYNLTKNHPLYSNVEVAAVFADDSGFAQGRSGQEESAAFRYLRSFCKLHGIKFHIEESYSWRRMPLMVDEGGLRTRNREKIEAKADYEEKMLAFMRENGIDVILSDSYVVLFDSVMLDPKRGYRGLIVNIHPGIASEVPGVFPTRDALARARFFTKSSSERESIRQAVAKREEIFIRRDGCDPSIANIFGRMGLKYTMDGNGTRFALVPNAFRATTGATLHIVDELIDHGPVILASSSTPIRAGDREQDLRARNYVTKNRVVEIGMIKFLKMPQTQALIAENRIRNRAFAGDVKRVSFGEFAQKSAAESKKPALQVRM
jgi:folate-dependent phosphoribosylglycinamide formyltransferase PurN